MNQKLIDAVTRHTQDGWRGLSPTLPAKSHIVSGKQPDSPFRWEQRVLGDEATCQQWAIDNGLANCETKITEDVYAKESK